MEEEIQWNSIRKWKTFRGEYKNSWCYSNDEELSIYMELKNEHKTIFDKEDFDLVKKHTFYAKRLKNSTYAYTNIPDGPYTQKTVALHTILMPDAAVVDHINGDTLDNRRSNLRSANDLINGNNRRMNINNTSGVNGIKRVVKTPKIINGVKRGRNRNYFEVVWYNNGKKYTKCFSFDPKNILDEEEVFEKAKAFRKEIDALKGCTNGERPKRMM